MKIAATKLAGALSSSLWLAVSTTIKDIHEYAVTLSVVIGVVSGCFFMLGLILDFMHKLRRERIERKTDKLIDDEK